jgi:adenosylcobinamide-GDP ribazoletransferase
VAEVTVDRDLWMRRAGPLYPALVAVRMLTRVPLPRSFAPAAEDAGPAAAWFPAVGAAVGLALAGCAAVAAATGLVAAVAGLGVVGLAVLIGGGRVEGGLARAAGVWAGRDGAGIGVAWFAVAVRAVALIGTATGSWTAALVVSQVTARFTPLLVQRLGAPADEAPAPRRGSLVVGEPSWVAFGVAAAIAAFAALVFGKGLGLLALVVGGLFGLGAALWAQRRSDDTAADTLAAVAVASELVVLLCFAAAHPAIVSPWTAP